VLPNGHDMLAPIEYSTKSVAKPIVKWAGGKRKLLPALVEELPAQMRTYVEPFVGGAALFFCLASSLPRRFERAILVDKNPELIACYVAVRDRVDEVIALLEEHAAAADRRALFYRLREVDTAAMSGVERAARFVFLNRTGFNGLWRVNASGKFNVPFGRYVNPRIVDAERLRAASAALARAEILHDDYEAPLADLGKRDFVYFDPPYVPLSRTSSFTAYASEGFGPEDQRRLAGELRALGERGVKAMLSNADNDETRRLYRGLPFKVVHAARSINSDATKRGAIAELIVRNWRDAPKATARRRAIESSS
jgi:DNA adenine methylase